MGIKREGYNRFVELNSESISSIFVSDSQKNSNDSLIKDYVLYLLELLFFRGKQELVMNEKD